MKVLNYLSDEPWVTEVRCGGCGSRLEISEKDLELFHYFGSTRRIEYLSVKCPVCNEIIQTLGVPNYVARRWLESHVPASRFDGIKDKDDIKKDE